MADILLKNIPEELFKHLLDIQGEEKVKKGIGKFSLCLTVFKIIRSHKEGIDKKLKG